MGKRFTGSNFIDTVAKHGTHGCNYLLTVDIEMEPQTGFQLANWENGFGDFEFRPDLSTLRHLPWQGATALVLCDAHHHDGLALFTPAQVFHGHVERVATRRQEALDAAYYRTPERFVNGPPAVARPPSRVLLNPADAAPPTVENVLSATAQELDALWPAAVSGMPIINLPGADVSQVDTVNAS